MRNNYLIVLLLALILWGCKQPERKIELPHVVSDWVQLDTSRRLSFIKEWNRGTDKFENSFQLNLNSSTVYVEKRNLENIEPFGLIYAYSFVLITRSEEGWGEDCTMSKKIKEYRENEDVEIIEHEAHADYFIIEYEAGGLGAQFLDTNGAHYYGTASFPSREDVNVASVKKLIEQLTHQ
jgi:hypothetical protein